MEKDPQEDDGKDPPASQGTSSEQTSEYSELKDQFDQQQVLIGQLREMLKKTDQTNVTQEKVDRYASTLSKMTVRAKKSKLKKEAAGASLDTSETKSGTQTPVNEKISLLRKQLEENKVKLAERGKNQKGIEEMVIQLKAQFDDSRLLLHDTSSNLPSLEPQIDYNRDSSSEELYQALLLKEKLINDLNSKVQKLEVNILDLQETVKEKDCVIDARTKAITLMTESLTRKGKSTQDTLDETKEQMRKMQEDFVTLENEMKARQVKLLDELRLKNLEIAELQEMNEIVKREKKSETVEVLLTTIEDLKAEIGNLTQTNEALKESQNKIREESGKKISELESIIQDLKATKKPQDDDNKNMSKLRAEHKKKIKTLNKRIDSFKKMGDLNEHIVKLSEENDTLKEKLALLEEEKGNYQLEMMKSISKDFPEKETFDALHEEINRLNATKLQLESDNDSLKQQIQQSSDMSFIQFEEIIEKLQKEKADLKSENDDHLDRIDSINKEKIELQSRLDHYIHENIELLDKLEKLSAEKVSSAESIEIVENLTHQEKLELEEFQKNLDVESGKLKVSEDQLEVAPDLNDSVNQLTEETSELLQKIELFTVERREVMEKLESLTSENSALILKVKQIENNRDVLTETYEQLQNEKEEVDNKLLLLKEENDKLKKDSNVNEVEALNKKLFDIEGEYLGLVEEVEELRRELKIKSELIHEKDNLEMELKSVRGHVEDLEKQLRESKEEIGNYQSVLEDNKEEFIKSASQINELQEKVQVKDVEIQRFKDEVIELNKTIQDFSETINNLAIDNKSHEENIKNIEILKEQLSQLKETLDENLGQIADYENELSENSEIMKQLNEEIKSLKNKNAELENILQNGNEVKKLEEEVRNLKLQIQEKDEMFHKMSAEMKNKFEALQKRTQDTTDSIEDIKQPLKNKIEDLTSKNNSLMEKMKKIAANLKKKSHVCQELEEKLRVSQEKWESELMEKNKHIDILKEESEMQQVEVKRLQQMLNEKVEREIPVKQEASLQEELWGSDIVQDLIPDSDKDKSLSKIQELELIIETQDSDIKMYKTKISSLEEALAKTDEQRESLKQKSDELGVQLLEKSQSFEEITKVEDMLEEKINHLSEDKEKLQKKLESAKRENEVFINENNSLKQSVEELKQKLSVSQNKVAELIGVEESLSTLEQQLEKSTKLATCLENEVKKVKNEKAEIEEQFRSELEKLNNDWQLQFNDIYNEKQELGVSCEKLLERQNELLENEQSLSLRVQELQDEISNLNSQNGELEKKLFDQTDLVNRLEQDCSQLRVENEELKTKLHEIQDGLNKVKAEGEIIEKVISSNESNPPLAASLFPSSGHDVFDFVPQAQATVDDSAVQLQKARTLEFMLKNVENERDELLNQCTHLTNELMKFVCDNQSQSLEGGVNVIEPPCVKKEAYLCYPEGGGVVSNMESQILSVDEIDVDCKKELREIEFTPTKDAGDLTEESCQKSVAYVCHPEETKSAFGDDDDGWGFNPEEAQLEANAKIEQLENEVKILRSERDNKNREYQELQVKSGKLIKKLKELKAQNEKLLQGNALSDLENAIQEELKEQLATLEKRIQETQTELTKEKNEKSTIQKKLEALTTTNQRAMELKEKQDIELLMWQRKCEEFKSKLEQFEWEVESGSPMKINQTQGLDESSKPSDGDINKLQATIAELNETIRELSLDNEELQELLEEQRNLRVVAERQKSVEPVHKMRTEEEYLEVNNQKQALLTKISEMEIEIAKVTHEFQLSLGECQRLEEVKTNLEKLIEEKNVIIQSMSMDLEKFKRDVAEYETTKEIINKEISRLSEENNKINEILLEKESKISALQTEINDKTNKLNDRLQEQNNWSNEKEILVQKNDSLAEEIQIIKQLLQTKDEDFARQIDNLNQEWQILVDQRGSDVADSWKAHVEQQETIFEETKQKLMKEIQELEIKYNDLMNENNELRKNVDAEIRNEIDKLSTLQQQINERQQYINELSTTLKEKQLRLDEVEGQIPQLQNNIENLQKIIKEHDTKIEEYKIIVETTQNQFDEQRRIVEGIGHVLQQNTSNNVLFDFDSILIELQKQLNSVVSVEDFERLQQELLAKDTTISELFRTVEEIGRVLQQNTSNNVLLDSASILMELQKQLNRIVSVDEFERLQQDLIAKDTTISELLKEKDVRLKETDEKMEEHRLSMQTLQRELNEREELIQQLKNQITENESAINLLTEQLQQTRSLKANENENVQNLQYSLQQYQQQYDELKSELLRKNAQLDQTHQELQLQQNATTEMEQEINNLKKYVEELQQKKDEIITTLKQQLDETNIQISEIMSEKETAINYLQMQIQEQNNNLAKYNDELSQRLSDYEKLKTDYEEQNTLLNDERKQLSELQAIIENQAAAIDRLNKDLYDKSNDYDSLIAEINVRKQDLNVVVSDRPPMGRGQLIGPTSEDDLEHWVSRSELDIALYMLHQRDVRCEELTVELRQLLEERDTLQLRLSNALREKEEFKKIASEPKEDVSGSPKGAIPKGRVSEILLNSSGTELATEAQETGNQLETKLSELKTIGYKKDKTLLDDQERRRLQQFAIMEQHIGEASKLPPEAAARLVDADYTLSRDVQSPSKVLLNWLWGKSTPKVNDL